MKTSSLNFSNKLFELQELGLQINPETFEASTNFENVSVDTFFSELTSATDPEISENTKKESVIREGMNFLARLQKEIDMCSGFMHQQKERTERHKNQTNHNSGFHFISFPKVNKNTIYAKINNLRKSIKKSNPNSQKQLFSPLQLKRIARRKQRQAIELKRASNKTQHRQSIPRNNN
ncbi:hypothetical protein M0813_12867 [Anaeramoeba flamelloides]|uniref:Uncharacterized protein n=1 Tax=Anaeramoeba flamelloides TaxID=1746091 RepID=A0AAV7YQS7_9EUKA|nr:hypothetical protein M0812_02723 [Anaeramoeba flamelloides]KAJ6253969.1 hypothetical protein M0813_12867 [Anaeramoeba flamelloides]